jgi:aspartyl-tRNA(Asn)/glutamyl-tRNA(Gln) amidotransferase subunit A
VLVRIRRGSEQSARDMIVREEHRRRFEARVGQRLEGFDAFISPTVPLVAPPLQALAEDDAYTRTNLLMLRNPTVINLLDGCAASVPMHDPGEAPTGLMVCGLRGHDAEVLRAAAWIEEKR